MSRRPLFLLAALVSIALAGILAGPTAEAATQSYYLRYYIQTSPTAEYVQPAYLPAPQPQVAYKVVYQYAYNQATGKLVLRRALVPVQQAPQPTPPAPQPAPQPQPTPPTPAPQPGAATLTADEQLMLRLVNQERAANGLAPLQVDPRLVQTARLKSQDMIANNYFDHNSPTYGSPFAMMRRAGVNFRYAGENLAGAPSVELAHRNLMNSAGHRANILNPRYTHIGLGIVNGGPYGKMFTQHFAQE